MKWCVVLSIATWFSSNVLIAQASKGCSHEGVVVPAFDAKNFPQPTTINNRYFPLIPGTRFVYESSQGRHEQVEVIVTNETKKILKVDTVVVRDTVRVGGEVIEDTLDFFAEDKDGNVSYFGEDSKTFDKGVLVGTEGSWLAGLNGAVPGFIMKAQPVVGDAYRQENAPGVAEDTARVLTLTSSASVPFGSWQDNVLVTSECTPLEPKVAEEKYYALDVGLVRTVTVRGGSGESVLVSVTH